MYVYTGEAQSTTERTGLDLPCAAYDSRSVERCRGNHLIVPVVLLIIFVPSSSSERLGAGCTSSLRVRDTS